MKSTIQPPDSDMSKISNFKLQTPKKLQTSTLNPHARRLFWSLKLEAYLKFEVWSLKFAPHPWF